MVICDMQMKSRVLHPYSQEAYDLLGNYRENQILKNRISGIQKEASVPQFRMFHACMRTVADNTEDKEWNDLEGVKIQLKHLLHFYKRTVVVPGVGIHFELDSFSFSNYARVRKEKIIDRAIPILAKKIGITVEKLLANAERYQ